MEPLAFAQLLAQYPGNIGFSAIPKIPWGLLDDRQYQTLEQKIPQAHRQRALDYRAQGWDPTVFTAEDRALFYPNIVDVMGQNYARNDPEYYFKYFLTEALASANWTAIAAVFNLLFDKLPAGARIQLKPALRYAKAVTGRSSTYTFTGGGAAAQTWQDALINLMVLGFHAQPVGGSGPLHSSLASAMLEGRFVEAIAVDVQKSYLGNPNLRVFWRCDSRDKANFLDTHTTEAAVDLDDRAAELNLSQPWNPFSAQKVKNALWLRKASKDNDYYTIVSVGMDFRTCTSFPTLDEQKNPDYQFPMQGEDVKPLREWTQGELLAHRKNLARVSVIEGGRAVEKIRICTKTHAYMAVVNSGFVINTQSYGGGAFPERAVRGLPVDSVVGYLPFLRVHHGGKRANGFTCFIAGTDPPVLLISEREMRNRFGVLAADIIQRTYFEARTAILGHLKSAWAANGSADPDVMLNVQRVIERPLQAAVQPSDPRLT